MSEKNLIEDAMRAADRLEAANKVTEALVARQEAIEKMRMLGGHSEAGAPKPPEMTEEEKIRIDTRNFFKGTAVEHAFR